MRISSLEGVRLAGIAATVPAGSEDSLARCTALCGSASKAEGIVRTTGIRSRRVLAPGQTALDLSVRAARDVLEGTRTDPSEIGAVVSVTFTADRQMPATACGAQARLGLPQDAVALDLNLACAGWPCGVFVAGLLARSLGRKVLLLDGDSQTSRLDPNDVATAVILADAGTATLVEPAAAAAPLRFAFLTDGAKGDALVLPAGGTIAMDGFAVFRFVTTDVLHFIAGFLAESGVGADAFDAFVPHQANVYMIRQMAAKLGLADRLKVSGDVLGNSASASVPTTIAWTRARGRLLAAAFGGGLSAAVADLTVDGDCRLSVSEL